MQLFSVDGGIYKFLDRFWSVVKLNFLWLVFSLPIITIGASTVAAFSVTLKMAENEEGHVARQFFKAFKENWKQGTVLGLIGIVATCLAYMNFVIFNQAEGNPVLALIAGIIIIFFEMMYLTYAFPLAARYDNTLINTLKNSAAISVKFFLRTLFVWFIVGILFVLFIFNTTLLFIGILVGPIMMIYTVSGFAIQFFHQIEKDNESCE